jgi:phosphoglycolate phosphatase
MLDIIDYYGIEANEAIMVGDTEYDLQMANNAAAYSVAVSYGVHEKQRLLDCKPLTCLDSINDLHQWLLS